jgi:hypothetical protein
LLKLDVFSLEMVSDSFPRSICSRFIFRMESYTFSQYSLLSTSTRFLSRSELYQGWLIICRIWLNSVLMSLPSSCRSDARIIWSKLNADRYWWIFSIVLIFLSSSLMLSMFFMFRLFRLCSTLIVSFTSARSNCRFTSSRLS